MSFNPYDLTALAPEAITLALALALILVEVLITRDERAIQIIAVIGLLVAGIVSVLIDPPVSGAFNGAVASDLVSQFLKTLLIAIALFVTLISGWYLKGLNFRVGEYYSLILLSTVGMMILSAAGSLLTLFLGIETMSIPLYVLAGIRTESRKSNEAALKYFLLGAFATGFLLFGIALTYGATGGKLNFAEIADAFKGFGAEHPAPVPLYAGIGLIMVGLLFKVAAAPFHFWSPDVYQGSPTPVTALMSAGPKAAALAAFIRLFGWGFVDVSAVWVPILWVIAVATMVIGNLSALAQTNIKRMLAFSSISHAGYLLTAVLAAGAILVREEALAGLLFYLSAYYLMNLGAFTAAIRVSRSRKQGDYSLDDYKGLASEKPGLAAAMSLFMVSLAGFPVTAGFMGKLYVFSAAVKAGYIWLVVIAVMMSLVSVYYYTRLIVYMYMRPAEGVRGEYTPAPLVNLALILCAAGVLALGVYPGPVAKMIKGDSEAVVMAMEKAE